MCRCEEICIDDLFDNGNCIEFNSCVILKNTLLANALFVIFENA